MTNSGEAAEQVIRIVIDGAEFALRIAGSSAKEVAAFLLAAAKSGNDGNPKTKIKGKERLKRLLQSGKELKIFSVKNSDLKKFAQEAKKYGVVYCALRSKGEQGDGTIDIMARAEDGAKIQRIMEKLEFAVVDKASIKEGKSQNPFMTMTGKSSPSENIFENAPETTRGISKQKESVKEFLRESSARRKQEAADDRGIDARGDKQKSEKSPQKQNTPINSQTKRKKKKKSRGGR